MWTPSGHDSVRRVCFPGRVTERSQFRARLAYYRALRAAQVSLSTAVRIVNESHDSAVARALLEAVNAARSELDELAAAGLVGPAEAAHVRCWLRDDLAKPEIAFRLLDPPPILRPGGQRLRLPAGAS
jgi:hypothetical protein